MIKCVILNRSNMQCVTLSGHAQYSTDGNDIVCAAVSMLCAALDESCRSNPFYKSSGTMDSGNFRASYDGFSETIRAKFEMLADGLRLVANQYPECLQIKQVRK